MEDKEFSQKLSEVFEFLLVLQNPITDDTCLQRLQDVLTEKYPNGCCPGLEQFLAKACEVVHSLEPSVIGFALNLCGHTASTGSLPTGCADLIQTISNKDLWKEPSIGTAYFKSLSVIVETQHRWIQENESDFLSQALASLQEKQSIFLHTSARGLLERVYNKCNNDNKSNNESSTNGLFTKLNKKVFTKIAEDFLQELNKTVLFPARGLSVYLQNLLLLLASTLHLPQKLDEEHFEEVLHNLLRVYMVDAGRSSSLCLDLLLHWLRLTQSSKLEAVSDFLKKEYLVLCDADLEHLDICKFHKIATIFQKRFSDIEESTMLEDIIMTPYWVAQGETVSESVPDKYTETVCSISSSSAVFNKLLLQTSSWIVEKKKNTKSLLGILGVASGRSDTRLLLSGLEGINNSIQSDSGFKVDIVVETLDVVLLIINRIHIHNGVLEKGLDCVISLLEWMARHPEEGNHLQSYVPLIATQLERCLVGTKWEHRDTAVEGVTKLVSTLKDVSCALSILTSSRVLVSAWQCVHDSDSYVRASSARLVQKLVSMSAVWETFLSKLNQEEEDIIDKLIEIVTADTEAFPRRAAVLSLLSIYRYRALGEATRRKITSTLLKALSDFDWEVKANALEFWHYVMEEHTSKACVPQYAADLGLPGTKRKSDDECGSNLDKLRETRFFTALVAGVEDYDQHVCEKTYKILKELKQKVNIADVHPSEVKKSRNQNRQECCDLSRSSDTNCSHSDSNHSEPVIPEPCESDSKCMERVMQILRGSDIDDKLSQLSGSVDEYTRNPLALLEDILSEDKDIENDKFVDCY